MLLDRICAIHNTRFHMAEGNVLFVVEERKPVWFENEEEGYAGCASNMSAGSDRSWEQRDITIQLLKVTGPPCLPKKALREMKMKEK